MDLFLFGEINDETILPIFQQIVKAKSIIKLHINSQGGEFYAGVALLDVIRQAKHPIHTIGHGLIASMAVPILASGARRSINESAWIMLHEGETEFGSQSTSNAKQIVSRSVELDNIYFNKLEKFTKRPASLWQQLCSKDTYLDAERAVKYGLADYISREG